MKVQAEQKTIEVYIRRLPLPAARRIEGKEKWQSPDREYRTISFELPTDLQGPEVERALILDYDFTRDGHSFVAGVNGEIALEDLRSMELALINFFEGLGWVVHFA